MSEAIIVQIPKRKWADLGLDEGDARVQQVMQSAALKDAFCLKISGLGLETRQEIVQ